jgi:hypothetical protein
MTTSRRPAHGRARLHSLGIAWDEFYFISGEGPRGETTGESHAVVPVPKVREAIVDAGGPFGLPTAALY